MIASPRPAWWSSDEWATPPEIVEEMAAQYGPFDLDVCCRPETAKAPCFFTKTDNALTQGWFGRVWMNPPYSNPRPWVQKAYEEAMNGNCDCVVALLPASTDTQWFHEWVYGKAKIIFRRGRIKFYGWEGTPIGSPKAGSIFAIYAQEYLPTS